MKHYKSVEILSIFRVPSPPAETQSHPIENFLATVLNPDWETRGRSTPLWQAKCKNWAPLAEILVFSIFLIFSRLLFFAFYEVFSFL